MLGGGEGTTVGEQGALEGGGGGGGRGGGGGGRGREGRERKEGCALLPETVSK